MVELVACDGVPHCEMRQRNLRSGSCSAAAAASSLQLLATYNVNLARYTALLPLNRLNECQDTLFFGGRRSTSLRP